MGACRGPEDPSRAVEGDVRCVGKTEEWVRRRACGRRVTQEGIPVYAIECIAEVDLESHPARGMSHGVHHGLESHGDRLRCTRQANANLQGRQGRDLALRDCSSQQRLPGEAAKSLTHGHGSDPIIRFTQWRQVCCT